MAEAIVLAGGQGSRLQSVIKDIPKPMAPVNGKPFLEYILYNLHKQKVTKTVLSVGYRYEVIADHFKDSYRGMSLVYSIEDAPLGTGGAIKQALQKVSESVVFICNGDTLFDIDIHSLQDFHTTKHADLSMAVKWLTGDRYGSIELDTDSRISGFKEKKDAGNKLINGGFYLLNTAWFKKFALPETFSFERDFIERFYKDFNFYGLEYNNYFIDIGVPEDYEKAVTDLSGCRI